MYTYRFIMSRENQTTTKEDEKMLETVTWRGASLPARRGGVLRWRGGCINQRFWWSLVQPERIYHGDDYERRLAAAAMEQRGVAATYIIYVYVLIYIYIYVCISNSRVYLCIAAADIKNLRHRHHVGFYSRLSYDGSPVSTRAYVCVCVCPSSPVHAHTHTHTHMYMYIMFEQRETNKKKKTPNWEKK